jgi:transcriptional regulator with XRE-family HTH domain
MTACGDLLKTLIAESGKPPKAIAAQAGITSPYLILLQQGQRKPSDEVVLALATALELDPHQTKRLQEAARLDRSTRHQPRPKHINGIVRVHRALPEETFGEWMRTATKRIWILQTWVARGAL